MSAISDWQRYNQLSHRCREMIRDGQIHYALFDDAFAEITEIKRRHGGMPPVPDDEWAMEQELVEIGVENDLR
jgi:hypothetical protein